MKVRKTEEPTFSRVSSRGRFVVWTTNSFLTSTFNFATGPKSETPTIFPSNTFLALKDMIFFETIMSSGLTKTVTFPDFSRQSISTPSSTSITEVPYRRIFELPEKTLSSLAKLAKFIDGSLRISWDVPICTVLPQRSRAPRLVRVSA